MQKERLGAYLFELSVFEYSCYSLGNEASLFSIQEDSLPTLSAAGLPEDFPRTQEIVLQFRKQ